ncbi:MAG: hypothetical protein CML03_01875 [Pseudooceanicola sp.]|nr:hypothetical protein [Pseudooceanicola sp.]
MPDNSDLNQLKKRSVRGGVITLVSQAFTVIMQLASTVVLARMLTPDDYGVMGMVLSFVALAALFKDLGLSSAAIQKANLTTDQQTNLFWINALFGLLLSAIVAAAAPLVAWFYGRPELVAMTWILSLTFLFGGLSAQHNAMMVRNMHFGRQGIVNIAGIAVTFAVSVSLAWLGYGYLALAWGHVAGAAGRALLIWSFSPFVPGRWTRLAGTKDMVKFGANVTGFNIVNYFSRNLDNILIGKFVGADALGVYGRAYQLMLFPIQNLRGPIDAVAYPAMCRLKDRPEDWRRYHMQTLRVLAFLSMPLVAWMFLVSEPLILGLLGDKWAGVVPIFRILAIVGFIQPSASMIGSVMLSMGHTRRYFLQGAVVAAVLALAFGIGIRWGAEGVAWAYVAAVYVALVPLLANGYRHTALTVVDFFESVSLPAVISIVSLAISLLAQRYLSFSGFLAEIISLTLVYWVTFLALMIASPGGRGLLVDAASYARAAVFRRGPKPL